MTKEQMHEIVHKLQIELNGLREAADANDEDMFRASLDDLYNEAAEQYRALPEAV